MLYPNVKVQLTGEDGNAFNILGQVQREMRRAHIPEEKLQEFRREATSDDYDHLLRTCMAWVDVQ